MKSVLMMSAAAVVAASASADTLYSNLPDLSLDIGFLNENTNNTSPIGFSPNSSWGAVDVTVGANGFNVSDISVFNFRNDGGFPTSVTEADLIIQSKSGSSLPSTVPFVDSAIVPVTLSLYGVANNGFTEVWQTTASGLDIDLAAGDYWVTLTPRHFTAFLGNGGVLGLGQNGDLDAGYTNFGSGFPPSYSWQTDPFGNGFDLAMVIEGTEIPAPGAAVFAALAGMTATRRRRV